MKICRPKFKAYAVVFLIGVPSSLREIYDTLNVNYFFLSKVLRLGQKNRHMASTKLNQLSSGGMLFFGNHEYICF